MNVAKYQSVSTTLAIGSVELPNRIVFPAWQVNYASTDGTVSDKLTDFYTAIADGGCGLIFTGAATVSPDSVAFDRVMRIDPDGCVPGLTNLFGKISSRGSVPGIPIVHYGRQAAKSVTGHDLLAPSAIPCPVMSQCDPEYVASGKADLAAMGRAQVADPGIVKKSLGGVKMLYGRVQNVTSVRSGRLATLRCTVASIRN